MATMLLGLDSEITFVYHGKQRRGKVVELRPKHDMVLVRIAEGQFRNFKISKMENLEMIG